MNSEKYFLGETLILKKEYIFFSYVSFKHTTSVQFQFKYTTLDAPSRGDKTHKDIKMIINANSFCPIILELFGFHNSLFIMSGFTELLVILKKKYLGFGRKSLK